MEIVILPTAKAAERLAARIVADRLTAKPDLVLGCATGATMEGIYAELVRLHREEGLSFKRATTFNLDEYVGLEPSDERSYHHYMRRHLFDRVDIDPANAHLPNGAADVRGAGARADEASTDVGEGLYLTRRGVAGAANTRYTEPLSVLLSRTLHSALTATPRAQNALRFGCVAAGVPERA